MKRTLKNRTFASLLSLLFSGSCLVLPGIAVAAEDEGDAADSNGGVKKPGYYTESFHILPEFQATGYYDDNIYATDQAKVSDYVAIFTPTVKIRSLWDRHSLKMSAGANFGRYQDNSAEDYNDVWAELDGGYDLGENSNLFGGAGYSKKHEARDSKESHRSGIEPTTYEVQDLRLGLRQGYGDLTLRVAGTYQALNYANMPASDGSVIVNDDRDRTVSGLGARATKKLAKGSAVYLQGFVNRRSYDETPDQSGYDRDSQGYTASVGMTRALARKGKFDAYIGMLSQEYDDPSFDRVTEPAFAVNLRWYPAETYKLTANLDRTLSETTELGASGYLYTRLDLQLDKKLLNNIVGYLSYGYGLADYQEVGREDVINSFGLGLNYYLSQKVLISGGFTHISNDSNDVTLSGLAPDETYDYERNLVLVSIKVKLSP